MKEGETEGSVERSAPGAPANVSPCVVRHPWLWRCASPRRCRAHGVKIGGRMEVYASPYRPTATPNKREAIERPECGRNDCDQHRRAHLVDRLTRCMEELGTHGALEPMVT